MSDLGLERYMKSIGLSMTRTPVTGDRYVTEHIAQARLQCRRRAVRPHRAFKLTTRRVTAWSRRCRSSLASFPPANRFRNVQPVRPAAASPEERALRKGPAARGQAHRQSHRGCQDQAGRWRPARDPPIQGTEPVIRVMAEGDDVQVVSSVVGDIVEAVKSAAA